MGMAKTCVLGVLQGTLLSPKFINEPKKYTFQRCRCLTWWYETLDGITHIALDQLSIL